MSRLLLLAVIVIVVYVLLKSYQRRLPGEGTPNGGRGENASEKDATGQGEDMVLCAHCGVHLPKRESIMVSGQFYCSEAHRRAHTGKTG